MGAVEGFEGFGGGRSCRFEERNVRTMVAAVEIAREKFRRQACGCRSVGRI